MKKLNVFMANINSRETASPKLVSNRLIFSLKCLVLVLITGFVPIKTAEAAKGDVYTFSGYPVDARAKDAVTAKKIALDEGQVRAFRSLLKRIVPVAYYGRLPKLKLQHVQDMIEGFSVRNEQNSRTEYLATLEFKFRKQSVRQLLKSYGVPYVDKQAPKLIVIPHYVGAWPGSGADVGTSDNGDPTEVSDKQVSARRAQWNRVWRELDLVHAVAPIELKAMHAKIHPDTIGDLLAGKEEAFKIVQEEYDTPYILLALAGPGENGRLGVRLIGADSIGRINLKRNYRIYEGDFLYTADLASYIGLRVLEGRWKSANSRKVAVNTTRSWETQQSLQAEVNFSGLYEWQQIRKKLTGNTDIDELKIGRLSARGADITIEHSGNFQRLQSSLRSSGLILEERGGRYSLRNQ